MLSPYNLKDMIRLHRMSVMKTRRKEQGVDPALRVDQDALRHAEWRAAQYENQEAQDRHHMLNERNVAVQERIAVAVERIANTLTKD